MYLVFYYSVFFMVYQKAMYNLNVDIDSVNGDLRRRVKYIRRCEDNARKRWENEYLKSLPENIICKARNKNFHHCQLETLSSTGQLIRSMILAYCISYYSHQIGARVLGESEHS